MSYVTATVTKMRFVGSNIAMYFMIKFMQ